MPQPKKDLMMTNDISRNTRSYLTPQPKQNIKSIAAGSPFLANSSVAAGSPFLVAGSPYLVNSSVSSVSSTSEAHLGSCNNPYVIYADLAYPERNLIFDIVHVNRIEFGGRAREGVDIRTQIGVGDKKLWSAWINNDWCPDYAGRTIMIQEDVVHQHMTMLKSTTKMLGN